MMKKYQEKLKALQSQLQAKLSQFQNMDNIRNQLSTEILELRGQIKMLEELIAEEAEKKEEPEKKETLEEK